MLKEIVTHKWEEIRQLKKNRPMAELLAAIERQPPPRDLIRALKEQGKGVGIIAEIKKAAPSSTPSAHPQNLLSPESPNISVGIQAAEYQRAGAAAVSVLTEDRFFAGSLADLAEVKSHVSIPVLRKDFIVDEYQLYESRAAGADAVLLISSLLASLELERFLRLVKELGMTALVEAGKEQEIEKAVRAGAEIIGINNRDLFTLEVDLERTLRWGPYVPRDRLLVSESGYTHRSQVALAKEKAGIDAVLVGRSLMNSSSPAEKIMELMGKNVFCAS